MLGKSNYHSAILTTFTFDPIYFTTLYLPRLRQAGVTNVIVLVDASNYDAMLQEYTRYGNHLSTLDFTLVRQAPTSSGVFHPKMAFLVGEKGGALFVGSGNLTYSGQSVNEEVWGALHYTDATPENRPVFKAAWTYLQGLLDKTESRLLSQQIDWLFDYSSWMKQLVESEEAGWSNTDGIQIRFLANADNSIYSQLSDALSNAEVEHIDIVAPFYDVNGDFIKRLQGNFRPSSLSCWVYQNGSYPDRMEEMEGVQFQAWMKSETQKMNLHAKIVQLQTTQGTYLCVGSANATWNAWGTGSQYGNDEAILLLHNPDRHDYIRDLGIQRKELDDFSGYEPRKQETKTHTTFALTLTHAEIVGEKLLVTIEPAEENVRLALLQGDGKVIESVTCRPGEPIKLIEEGRKARLVVAVDAEEELSNRCLIIDEEAIVATNPNPKGRELTTLINSSTKWNDKIAKILQFVSFEVPTREKTVVSMNVSVHKEREVRPIAKEQFDDVTLKGKASILSMDNIKIVDFLCASLFGKRHSAQEAEDGADEITSEDEAERGSETRNSESIFTNSDQSAAQVAKFLKRYNGFLDNVLADFDKNSDKNRNHQNSPKPLPKVRSDQGGTLTEYSAALTATALTCGELTDDTFSNKYLIRRQFIESVGRFLLKYGGGYPDTGDYAFAKKNRMHQDLGVYALLCLSLLPWDLKNGWNRDLLLMVLNILDSFKDNHELRNKVIEAYREVRQNYLCDSTSVQLVESSIGIFETFKETPKELSIQEINPYWEDVVIYKQDHGFMIAHHFKRTPNLSLYDYQCNLVGYRDKTFTTRGGMKVVLVQVL